MPKEELLMRRIQSNADRFSELNNNTNEGPFVMLNLLKFKQDGGRELYAKYVIQSGRFVEAVGAKVVYLGKPRELLNGSESWDLLMLVKYPSRKAFTKMIDDPEYLETHKLREAAVERAVLYATDEISIRDFVTQKG
jgi:uncharacterized protein (DUF1330 family)